MINWQATRDRTSQSVWARVLAGLCLCLLLLTSSLQAIHTHPGPVWTSGQHTSVDASTQTVSDNDSSCPLCTQLHNLLHLGSAAASLHILRASEAVAVPRYLQHSFRLRVALDTRPPPAHL